MTKTFVGSITISGQDPDPKNNSRYRPKFRIIADPDTTTRTGLLWSTKKIGSRTFNWKNTQGRGVEVWAESTYWAVWTACSWTHPSPGESRRHPPGSGRCSAPPGSPHTHLHTHGGEACQGYKKNTNPRQKRRNFLSANSSCYPDLSDSEQ